MLSNFIEEKFWVLYSEMSKPYIRSPLEWTTILYVREGNPVTYGDTHRVDIIIRVEAGGLAQRC